jgi:predicted kinase
VLAARRGRLSPAAHAIYRAVRPESRDPTGASLFLVTGLPGAGKTTFAAALARLTGATVIESDRFRGELFGEPVFSSRENGLLFRGIQGASRLLLAEGLAVIIDATNIDETDRRPFYRLADGGRSPLLIAALTAPEAVIEKRLRERVQRADGYSYADLDVYHRMRGRVEPISRPHWRVDTSDQASVEAALTSMANEFVKQARLSGVGSGWGARGTGS